MMTDQKDLDFPNNRFQRSLYLRATPITHAGSRLANTSTEVSTKPQMVC